ncbi:signal peptide peptidase SppA [Edwardsiella piscicida]|uniref:signal peptide peptidase SppA n=1 Tax=Edwardsiella piscicida TaxID=1263550 RepID=UPI0002C13074|nr:signal peptide peptidase SppA [Edwardsiella piscicida]AGH73522.1 Protease IV [Edwardsiella piscicida C07-087]AOP42817.1 signal peptide peptidase SppA [Edwardsiella piscicida]EKS7767356.1 signal peptide peptidase SppA [Edwardsiella piscicida]EKS7779204.1 signal peptide peptidase SppA [Edwardsiella piscicida]EKS7782624.1 signal peptide peptidase SppA [Edwardsiella piscicida]
MRMLWRSIAGAFRWCWRILNFIREFILNLFLVLLILIGVGIYLQFQDTPVDPATKGALLVDLNGVVVDNPALNSKFGQLGRELLGIRGAALQENSLFDLVETLRQAKSDPNITGLVLSLNNFAGADQPSLQYIGKALAEFRASGKPILAVGESYTQAQYFLASYANKIYLSPQGSVGLQGMATNNLYYKSLLDKLDVSTHIFRVGTYKSAVEPLMRDQMSPQARSADSQWLNGMWNNYLATVAANRHLTPEQVFPGAEQMLKGLQATGGDMAQYAVLHRLVDGLASRSEIEGILSKQFGWDTRARDYRHISLYDYPLKPKPTGNGQIAVIFASGPIIDGEATPGSVGGDTTAAQIRQARLDPAIRAIILRVNSPGGSVTASEEIRSALAAARDAGKPVVVSMGGLAASGGYWISTPANAIIASPSTLTGSIGIFGVINTFEKPLSQLGVYTDGVATSPLADTALTKALPQSVSDLMQLTIENGYQRFISLVATARHKTPAQIDSIAQGRVWLGVDAKANGLVDRLGDFDDAVSQAATLAGIKQPQLRWYVDNPSFSEMVFSQLTSSVQASLPQALQGMIPASLLQLSRQISAQSDWVASLNDPQQRYALCLSCSEIR